MLNAHTKNKWHNSTALWAFVVSAIIVVFTSVLARAALNLKAATIDQPDLAMYLLLPEENITSAVLIRDDGTERSYLAETDDGKKIVRLKKTDKWYVSEVEALHE